MPYCVSITRTITLSRAALFEILIDFGNVKERSTAAIESVATSGTGIGMLRHIKLCGTDTPIIERLEYFRSPELISYSIVNDSPLPVDYYHSVIELSEARSDCCDVRWSSNWIARGRPEEEVRALIEAMYTSALDGVVAYTSRKSKTGA